MNLKTLRAFTVLSEELHFGRAAQRCGISQPAMSRMLSDLESDLGVKLLNRTSREVSLTKAGRAFLESARKSVTYADMAVRAAQAETVDGIESLTIGLGICTEQPLLGRLIAQFKHAHPETRITLRPVDERSLGSFLTDGVIDVAIAWGVSIPTGFHRRHLGTVPMSVLVQSGHELELNAPVSLADLSGYPIILPDRERHPIIYDAYRRSTAEAGFELKVAMDVTTILDTLALVAAGVGISNAPVMPGLVYPGVSVLKQDPAFVLCYELVWAEELPSVTSLLECCRQIGIR